MAVKDYLRERFLPHMWCPGCGHGEVLGGLVRAIENLGLSKNEIVMVSGIGCSSRISGYVDFHTLHTIHGRALAFATGVKISRPELKLIVPMGDGDALAIGGNHFIHAARRNLDMTAIVMNNRIYGMTGGQFSPLSGANISATTAPYRTIDRELRRGGVGEGRRGHVCGPLHDLPRAADDRDDREGHHAQGLFGGGSPHAMPDLFRAQEQDRRGGGHDHVVQGQHHPHRVQGQAGKCGAHRTRDLRSDHGAGILRRIPKSRRTRDEGADVMERCRLVFSGSGGQGVITAAILLAEAAVLCEGLNAVQSQSYGAEARGGATRSDVIIADGTIHYPKVLQPNVLVCLTQEAYNRFASIVRPGGLLITDTRYVKIQRKVDAQQRELPMYRTVVEQVGKPIVFNICMLGAVITLADLVRPESIMKVLEGRVPKDFLEMNQKALQLGVEMGNAAKV